MNELCFSYADKDPFGLGVEKENIGYNIERFMFRRYYSGLRDWRYISKSNINNLYEYFMFFGNRANYIYTLRLSAGIYYVAKGIVFREDFTPLALTVNGKIRVTSLLRNRSEKMFVNRLSDYEIRSDMFTDVFKGLNLPKFKRLNDKKKYIELWKHQFNMLNKNE